MLQAEPKKTHLVCDSSGAGKTAHALNPGKQLGALHLSIDDWMARLFSPDMHRELLVAVASVLSAHCCLPPMEPVKSLIPGGYGLCQSDSVR
jgi:hypothetical protein